MIKTVSFAPPRSARAAKAMGKSASKTAPAQPALAATAATPAATPRARATSGSSPITSAEENISAPRRRAAKPGATAVEANVAEVAVAKSKAAKTKATIDEIADDEVAVAKANAKPVAPKKPRAKKVVTATPATSQDDFTLAFETPAKSVEAESIETAEPAEAALAEAKSEPLATPKIKRSRAPKDLAAQYGAAPETEVAPRVIAEKTAPRKRLTREAKAARSQMLRPDDDVLQRLQQANAVEVKKPASRGRGWEFECGCCGRVTRFQTPAAICECGAIAVKE